MQKFASINFAQDRNQSFIDRFLTWALSAGRTIVVLTEALALCAFIFRFSLDKQIIDLHGHIKDEQAVVRALNTNESTFRNLQNRLASIKSLSSQASQRTAVLEEVFTKTPPELSIQQAQINATTLTIQATTTNTNAIETFITALKADTLIKNIALTQVENKTSTGTIIFGLTGTIK